MYSCLRILSILAFAALLFLECAVSKHCFRIRHPRRGTLGRCEDEINLQRDRTKEACCYAGGAGWAVKPNGIKCKDACEGVVDGPEPNPDQPEKETTIQPTINDEGEEKYCFLERQAKGSLGSCTSPIGMKTKKGCCNGGGKGWTERESGIRCEDPCIVGYCFDTLRQKQRDRGNKCSDLSGEMDKNQCCQARGSGWSNLSDGRKCVAPCEQDQGITAAIGTTAEVAPPRREINLEATTQPGTTAKGTTAEVTRPRTNTEATTPPWTTAKGTTAEGTTILEEK